MAGTLTLEIVSPEELLFSSEVEMAVIPAAEGEMGVLPGHAPMVVSLRPGAVRAYAGKVVTREFFVVTGFAEVTAGRCTVVASEAVSAEQFSEEWAERRAKQAEEDFKRLALSDDPDARDDALMRTLIRTIRAGGGR